MASTNRVKSRVTHACDRCRARKEKCDGNTPACTTCEIHEAECVYSQLRKRGKAKM
ncbi:hypothetical protein GQ53DRAFT_740999 [Thozetella sp. PMI_491]|nr:hypothetical protein GQ53DRAFT_740999 [Thozetella sp. PMI_491]